MRVKERVLLDRTREVFHWTDGARRPWCLQDDPGTELIDSDDAQRMFPQCEKCWRALAERKLFVYKKGRR